jgi:hypothetical protein
VLAGSDEVLRPKRKEKYWPPGLGNAITSPRAEASNCSSAFE